MTGQHKYEVAAIALQMLVGVSQDNIAQLKAVQFSQGFSEFQSWACHLFVTRLPL